MSKIHLIKDILTEGSEGSSYTLCAWIRSKRVSKNCTFIAVNDGSCQRNLQLILPLDFQLDELTSKELNTGASIKVSGLLAPSPAAGQDREIQVQELQVLGTSSATEYPLQKKGHTLEFLREIAHLRPRTNTFGAVFRVRNALSAAIHGFFQKHNFYWVHTPILTALDAEGAGELFQVTTLGHQTPAPKKEDGSIDYSKDFFGQAAFLTVSGQLEAEFMALAMGKVYTFGPTFRAENSNTTRHLAEFWMVEPEMAFCNLEQDMAVAEALTRHILSELLQHCSEELEFFSKMYKNLDLSLLRSIAESSFERMSYTKAIAVLEKAPISFEFKPVWGQDLQTEHERYLAEKFVGKPVFIHDYPKEIKAFYMRANDDGKTVAATDLLVPGIGELIGGSQREDRYDRLEAKMKAHGLLKTPALQWYLDLRRHGGAPHAGFGMGFERMLMFATGVQNIRDVIPCPRAPGLINY
ncbi:MAG: asparagine--tRNA ligase [Oligoflexales bacterium]|nr:asparagine--tRNA ligase [Oligoflexales bacterium]